MRGTVKLAEINGERLQADLTRIKSESQVQRHDYTIVDPDISTAIALPPRQIMRNARIATLCHGRCCQADAVAGRILVLSASCGEPALARTRVASNLNVYDRHSIDTNSDIDRIHLVLQMEVYDHVCTILPPMSRYLSNVASAGIA